MTAAKHWYTSLCFLVLIALTTNAQDQPCTTYYKWSERFDDQDQWDFDGNWRTTHVDSECPDYSQNDCCDHDECNWIHQSEWKYWSDNRDKLDSVEACKADHGYNIVSRDNGFTYKSEGSCVAKSYPLGFRPFTLTAFNKSTPCIQVEDSAGGIVEILIETDSAARICIADSDSIGNVDRARGEVLQGHCSSDGRLHACINADTRQDGDESKLKDLKFYVWCDQNCMEDDTVMMIRTQKSAVKWDKLEKEGVFSAAYYGYAAEDSIYYKSNTWGLTTCKSQCFQDSLCQSYSWSDGTDGGGVKCKLSRTQLNLFSWECDLRNRKNPRTPVPKDGWETRDLLDAATGNAEMWCMYEAGLKAKDCKPLVRFPSDLNNDVPAAYIELFYEASPASALQAIVPVMLALWRIV